MSSESRAKRLLAVALVWTGVIVAGAVLYKLVIAPKEREDQMKQTGSKSRFSVSLRVAIDSFSGYCLLRSPALVERMSEKGVRLEFVDDGADGSLRLRRLQEGQVDAAVFTIDSLLRAGATAGEFPSTIVLVLDESRGADAMLAPEQGVRAIDDLDHPDARVVCVADSPAETLARLVYAQFAVSVPIEQWLERAATIEEVYRRLEQSSSSARRAFVLWEPWVSRAEARPGFHSLVDSSDFQGYVLDVLTVSRAFLTAHEAVVEDLVATYLEVAYAARSAPGGMQALVLADAKGLGVALEREQAQDLVEEIHWKNTLENYAHFGLLSGPQAKGVKHLEDVIHNVSQLLVGTGAMRENPLADRESWLFYDGVMRRLQSRSYHPGGAGGGGGDLSKDDPIEDAVLLRPLSPEQWEALIPVGTLRHEPISFARGTARLNISSQRSLEELAQKLATWPHYYLVVVGHARAEGDVEANQRLALERADAAKEELIRLGVPALRLRAISRSEGRSGAEAQSVTFELVQAAY